MPRSPRLVMVEWDDSVNDAGRWLTEKEIQKFAQSEIFHAITVGWLIREDDLHLTVASTKADVDDPESDEVQQHYTLVQRIPKGCIIRKRYINAP